MNPKFQNFGHYQNRLSSSWQKSALENGLFLVWTISSKTKKCILVDSVSFGPFLMPSFLLPELKFCVTENHLSPIYQYILSLRGYLECWHKLALWELFNDSALMGIKNRTVQEQKSVFGSIWYNSDLFYLFRIKAEIKNWKNWRNYYFSHCKCFNSSWSRRKFGMCHQWNSIHGKSKGKVW